MSERSSGTWSSLRHRNFALLWLGQSVSLTGDGIFSVALAIVALDVDRSPAGLSYVLAARLIPTVVFLLLGGAVADRVSRRLIMLASDLARGLVVGVVTVLLALGRLTIAELVVMSLLFGVA
ncbi:MAG: MFS transporter, partial [Actinomycetota bacterium]|nr:MFS transporter [Actinomycetota bacterium]